MTEEERSDLIRRIRDYVRGTGADYHNRIEALQELSDEELQSKLKWYQDESRNKWRGR